MRDDVIAKPVPSVIASATKQSVGLFASIGALSPDFYNTAGLTQAEIAAGLKTYKQDLRNASDQIANIVTEATNATQQSSATQTKNQRNLKLAAVASLVIGGWMLLK